MRLLIPGDRLPKPPVWVVSFAALCGLLASGVIFLHFPLAVLFFLSFPLALAVLRYPRWVSFSTMGLALLTAFLSDFFISSNFASSVLQVALASLSTLVLLAMLGFITHRHLDYEDLLIKRFHIIADTSHFFETWQLADGSFDYVSPSCEQITGYPPEDFMDNPRLFYEIIHADDRQAVEDTLQESRRRSRAINKLEFRIQHRNGKIRWVEHLYRHIYDDEWKYLGRRATTLDINERKLSYESLKVKFDRLMMALESTEDGVWDVNLMDGSVYFTPQYAHSLGEHLDNADAHLKDLHAMIHPDDLPIMLQAFKNHLVGKSEAYQAEYRLNTPSGNWRWVLDRGKVIENDIQGRPSRMVGTHMDITFRKNIEQALQESETKFRQLAENMREVFWLRDRQTGEFLFINAAFSEIWGRNVDDLYKNQNIFIESIHWEDLARVLHALTELVETGKILNEEYRIIQPDGVTKWVWTRAYPIYDNRQFYRIAGVAEDITERKKSESAMRDSERRYRDLIEHQGGGVSIIDPSQTIVYMNPSGEEIYGVPRGTMISRNMQEFLDDNQFSFLQSQSNIRQSGIETTFELTIIRPDKERRNVLITATPRFDVNGQFLGVIAIFRDNTQRKQTEDRLRYISLHDTLTELYNRAFFEDEIAHIEQVGRYPVSVIMADVDGLKQVNDQLGHQLGDELLRRVALALKDSVRSDDVVARIGGDEFAILMPSSDENALQQVLNRIQQNVGRENEGNRNPFTLSISAGGVTCIQRGGLRDAIREADARMYAVKEEQKKRFFFSLPTNTPRKPNQK